MLEGNPLSRPNEILLHALTSPPMEGAYADSLRSELVVLTLSACPDIVQPYVDHISPFLLPRPDSSSWFGAMDLVCQIYHACTNHLVVRCTDAMEHWTNAQQAAQSIVDGCFLSPKIAESVGAALKFSESQEVMDKAHELIRILRKNVVILLTWISTTEKFPTSLFTSEQFKMELRKLIRERMPTTETMQKFDKLFDKTLKDSAILKDQVLPSVPTEVGKCEDDIPETPKPNPLENVGTLDSLPAELRKPLRRFFNCSEEAPLSAKLMKALNVLPEITNVCISNYFNVPIILRCLAKGFRLARMQGYTELKFDNMNLLDSMLNHWEFPNIILPDPASEARPVADEMDGEVVEENHTSEMITSFLREAVFDLLTELTLLDPEAVLTRVPVLWFLASYNATLSSCDRHILRIIYLMESNSGHLLTRPNDIASVPLTWGPTVLRHYQFNTKARNGQLPVPVTCMAPNLNSLFNMIDEDNLLSSSIRFPMRRPWLGQVNSFSLKAAATEDEQQLYDPCFLLHALYHYLQQYKSAKTDNSTERFLRRFYTSNCLAFAVAGLTSYSKHLRSIARSVIAEYRSLALAWKPVKGKEVQNDQSSLFSSVFPERPQVLFILDTIRNSLATGGGLALGGGSRKRWMLSSPLDTGGRLTKVHANFFIRALQLLSKPENCMYQSIWNCLLSKPAIDLTRVPDFLRNFFSTSNMFRVERQWISRLCAESLGDTADYLVMENSHVFKHMLGVYSSPSSDPTFQLYILQLLRSATSHPRLCHTLTRFHAIPLWLWRNALSTGSAAHVKHFRAIIDHMLAAFSGQPEESPSLVVVRLLSEEFQKMHGVSRLSKSDSCMVNPPVDDMTETI
ncbi:unnamed protein product [Calicophoron daubneyi]|uniref:URB1 C-terminal domain-containing protein n=1 Tax=Calicophoron daubneyi TaxID=300641 RepID=A0AAV2TKV2_CALDB